MELNPILTRESRARWRRQAFLLLFFGVAIFAVIMYFCYQGSTTKWDYVNGQYIQIANEASAVGPVLFQQLTMFHVVGWMMLSPLLTATTIAYERERGLLEGLQLSQLTPGAIVRGKLYSALTFAGLMVLSLLPIIAICFLLGGVSPGEFMGAALQTFVAALLGASIGLCVSARSRRAVQGVTNTVALVLFWGFGSWMALAIISLWPNTWIDIRQALAWLSLLNPGLTMASWLNIDSSLMPPFLWTPLEPWLWGCVMQLALSLWLLWLSARAVKKPFDEQYWVEIGAGTDLRDLIDATARKETKTGRKTKTHVPRERWELPIVRFINLENPILQRDLRAKFIFRRAKFWNLLAHIVAVLLAAGFYSWLVWLSYTDHSTIGIIWPAITGGLILAMILVPALVGANAFTREREAGTWEGIRLSLLSPTEIILGKQCGAFAVAPIACLILVPLILPCFLALRRENYYPHPPTLWQIIFTFVLLYATAWVSAAWGLRISWASRKTASATGWTVASIFIALAVAPTLIIWFLENALGYGASNEVMKSLAPLHPYGAFAVIFADDNASLSDLLGNILMGVGFFIVFGCLLLGNLRERMLRSADSEER